MEEPTKVIITPLAENVIVVPTTPFKDQKPGTSGLRKKVSVFRQENYIENFVQAILEATKYPKHLIIGGDGRYYIEEAVQRILNVCVANGIQKITIPENGLISTPNVSASILLQRASGAIILTASHNPGGPDGDFGIKYNTRNSGPAPERVTDAIYEVAKNITSYKSLKRCPEIKLNALDSMKFFDTRLIVYEPVHDHYRFLWRFFSMTGIRRRLFVPKKEKYRPTRKILVDCMNGVMGPFARTLICDHLGAPPESVINDKPLPDFGGKHPDPNLTYASELVETLKNNPDIDLGCAFDGDGDRCMILGSGGFFVSPGDSVAIVADHIMKIPVFKRDGFGDFARSFPTSPALDRVAKQHGGACYSTPTGWKYFGNLLDANIISICGEESFGMGAKHIREKDGLWALCAWLMIMAHTRLTVVELVKKHWSTYGRDYFLRYDFEEISEEKADILMKYLEAILTSKLLVGKVYGENNQFKVIDTGNFVYYDPVEHKKYERQGLYIKFNEWARVVFRLSGTGSQGATLRMYISDYSKEDIDKDPQVFLRDLIDVAFEVGKLTEYIERFEPTVVT